MNKWSTAYLPQKKLTFHVCLLSSPVIYYCNHAHIFLSWFFFSLSLFLKCLYFFSLCYAVFFDILLFSLSLSLSVFYRSFSLFLSIGLWLPFLFLTCLKKKKTEICHTTTYIMVFNTKKELIVLKCSKEIR